MRTVNEILARILIREKEDFFGFEIGDLIACLPFSDAKRWLKKGTTESEWEPESAAPEAVRARLIDYLPFAWDKANNCRGISAGRSISHMKSWLWLMGEDDFLRSLGDLEDYEYYGKPQLREISERFGVDWRALDDGVWRNDECGDGIEADRVPRMIAA